MDRLYVEDVKKWDAASRPARSRGRRFALSGSDEGFEYPASSDSYDRLHHAGWSVGDAALVGESGKLVWVVTGHNGESLLRAEGRTRAGAWWEACCQAAAVGMLG